MSLSRRSFLHYTGPLAVLPILPRHCTDLADRYINDGSPFLHGVASGDPLEDRVVLWTRVTGDADAPAQVVVIWSISKTPSFERLVASGATVTGPEVDHTVKVDPDGLKPAATYYYRFRALGHDSAIGRFRTAGRGNLARARLAVASCSNYPYGYFNAYAAIARRADLDAVLHLGDYLYEYGNGTFGDGTTLGRVPNPDHEIVTLADYRARHAQYKTDPDLQEAHRQHAFIPVWDDHEVTNDAWQNGAENHQPDEGDFEERKAAAIQAYFEWMPIRAQLRDGTGRVYRSFHYGRLFDLFMLDTRLAGRDQQVVNPCDGASIGDPNRQLLGEEQEAWLLSELEHSARRGVRWRLLGQQVMFGQLINVLVPGGCIFNPDQWDGYAAARARVLDKLTADAIDNVVVLTGDIHSSWGNDLTGTPFNPLSYDAATGEGSLAVELVTPAVTSPGIDDPVQAALLAGALRQTHPHVKYVDLFHRGYALLDVTRERVQCEWYHVATIMERSADETLAHALQVVSGTNHLAAAEQPSVPVASAPALAPVAAAEA
ncbi:MAG TPA: alkaline phosphatase D family protein [Polyangiaceae bacterium]|nr:alkaline phosphatase D family protein [Polyangiaceae bacterium]